MDIPSRLNDLTFGVVLFALGMVCMTVLSMIEFIDYVTYEDAEAFMAGGLCLSISVILVAVLAWSGVPLGIELARLRGTKESLRALYVFMLFPVLFVSVVLGMASASFYNVLLFGWPLFIAGAVLVPWAASTMKREASQLLYQARCGNCRELFDIDRSAARWKCPYCSVLNRNPLRPMSEQDGTEVQPHYWSTYEAPGIPPWPKAPARMDLRGLVQVFMVPSALMAMFVGAILLSIGPDDVELALGLGFLFVGVFGIGASLVLALRRHALMALVASLLLVLVGIGSVSVVDVFGLFVGLFAAPGLVFALMLLKERELERDEATFTG